MGGVVPGALTGFGAGAVVGALVGALAGGWGALLLRRILGGTAVPVPVCAVLVAGLWAVTMGYAERLPLWWWPVPLVLGWAGVLLGTADVLVSRLPDALTLGGYPVAVMLVALAAAGSGQAELPGRALAGALLWGGGYLVVRLVSVNALGGGDVKLAVSLGALTATTSWSGLALAVFGAAVLTTLLAVPARLRGRADVPHGPAMLVVSWLVVLSPPA